MPAETWLNEAEDKYTLRSGHDSAVGHRSPPDGAKRRLNVQSRVNRKRPDPRPRRCVGVPLSRLLARSGGVGSWHLVVNGPHASIERADSNPDLASDTVGIHRCRDERTTLPDWSRRKAREMLRVEPLELPGGHCPHVSRPCGASRVAERNCLITLLAQQFEFNDEF
jgi:hypothetical protein